MHVYFQSVHPKQSNKVTKTKGLLCFTEYEKKHHIEERTIKEQKIRQDNN